jgi:hypothetical protein
MYMYTNQQNGPQTMIQDTIWEYAFILVYDTKEHQNTRQSDLSPGAMPPGTNRIASCFDALSNTYIVT